MNNNQPKTPGAMVLVSRELLHLAALELERADGPGPKNRAYDLRVALSNAEQTPAVGGEPDFWVWLDRAYRDGSKGEHAHFTKYNMEVAYSAGRAPLLAEIERLKAENVALRTAGEVVAGAIPRLDAARARIAELEAQQGEPVAWALDVEGYKAVIIEDHQRALYEQQHFRDRGRIAEISALYRQGLPATAKVALPPRKEPSADSPYLSDMDYEYNALLNEIAKLNP